MEQKQSEKKTSKSRQSPVLLSRLSKKNQYSVLSPEKKHFAMSFYRQVYDSITLKRQFVECEGCGRFPSIVEFSNLQGRKSKFIVKLTASLAAI
jgi:hypothetical protein